MNTLASLASEYDGTPNRKERCGMMLEFLERELTTIDSVFPWAELDDLRRALRDVQNHINTTKTMCRDELAGYLSIMAAPERGAPDCLAHNAQFILERTRIKPL